MQLVQLALEILHQMLKKSSLVQHVTPGNGSIAFLSGMKFKIMQLVQLALEILHQMLKKSSLVQHVTPGFYPFFYFLIALTLGFFIQWT